jgi:site-specific DNA-methyltransferase (adenine-specific)
LNEKNVLVCRSIFDIDNQYNLNIYCGDSLQLDIEQEFGVEKFDIIVGNPPYNEELLRTGATPLYHKFIEYYVDKCLMMSFIVPSRWFAGGKGLHKFRNMMLNRNDIVYMNHFDDASSIFGNTVDIKGGVNYFLIVNNYNGMCNYNGTQVNLNNFDIVLQCKYYSIVNKLLGYDNITDIYLGRYFGIESNDKRLESENRKGFLRCFVSQQKGLIKYIDKNHIKKQVENYKVITARAAFEANSGFGNTFIGKPKDVHTGSYISFNLNSEFEAESLLSYLKCKLPNFMLSLRKISQDINESTCKWIPLPPLDRLWCDDDVYIYFELSEEQIELVKTTKIKGYKEMTKQETKQDENLNKLSRDKLIQLCKERKIKGYSKLKKQEIIDLLS